MKINLVLPELGEGITSAVIASWNYQKGDRITQASDLVEVVTDKAVFNVPSDENGILAQIIAPAGKEVKVGEVIAIIQKDDEQKE